MNVLSQPSPLEKISDFLQVIAPTARLEILLAIDAGEVCVCHLEAQLGYRQAYISQHLMALRNANLIESRREGRYIYHRLKAPELLGFIHEAARLSGFETVEQPTIPAECCCPNCTI